MRLGNTQGKNKGKKYLKITGNEIITPENQLKANNFKAWFGDSYKRLQMELVAKRTYNEDILNDTFIRIHDKILYGGIDIANYKAYFHRAFFTNYVQDSMKETKISRMHISDEYANTTPDEGMDEKLELQQKHQLYVDVMQYVKNQFNETDFNVFVNYVKRGNRKQQAIANNTGLPHQSIVNTISKIKKRIRRNKQFTDIRQLM